MRIQTEAESFWNSERLMKKLQNSSYPHQITVCVPIYNAEHWLSQCLDSLVAQDIWEKIFIILVNDGSEDGSLKIAQQFSRDYPKKTLLLDHGENKGSLAARYSAIMRIETPFAMFVDSDDLLPSFACSDLYEAIIEKKADFVMGKIRILDGIDFRDYPLTDQFFQYFNEADNLRLQGDYRLACLPMVGKIYRTKILKATIHEKKVIEFPAISCGEDPLLSAAIFMKAQKIFLANKIIYYYKVNEKSITHNIDNKCIIDYLLSSLNIWKLAVYYNCLKLAEQGGVKLNNAEREFCNAELCFPHSLRMLNIFSSMNKIANSLGENFQLSLILEQENKLVKQFDIPRISEILEIYKCRFYSSKKNQSQKNQNTLSHNYYEFRRVEFKEKIWAITRTSSKRLKLYKTIRTFVRIFRCTYHSLKLYMEKIL